MIKKAKTYKVQIQLKYILTQKNKIKKKKFTSKC